MRPAVLGSLILILLGLGASFPAHSRAQGYPIEPFKAAANQVADSMDQIDHNYQLCKDAVEQSRAASTTPNDPGFAAMDKPLADLAAAWKVMKDDADQVAQSKIQFKLLYGTDKEIGPSDPRWKQLNGLKDQLQKQLNNYQSDWPGFQKAENEYAKVGGQYHFGWLKVSDLIDPQIQRMGYRKKELAKLEGIVEESSRLHLEGRQAGAALALRQELKDYQDDWKAVQEEFAGFQKQCAGRDYLYGGPGVPPVTEPGDISRKMKKMKRQYKKAVAEWKTIDPKVLDDGPEPGND